MKLASGQADGIAAVAIPSSLTGPVQHRFFKAFVMAVIAAACLFLLSIFLPGHLATVAQDLMCWFLLGAAATAVLVAGVKFLDGFLDL